MERLLAFHGIELVSLLVEGQADTQYAFTPAMAANNIFIEFRTALEACEEPGMQEKEEEYDDEEYDFFNEDDSTGEVELGPHEFGSRLSVLIRHKDSYYEFLMFYNTIDLRTPVLLAQTVIFLANLCDKTDTEELMEMLVETCYHPLVPDEISSKIELVQQAIRKSNPGGINGG